VVKKISEQEKEIKRESFIMFDKKFLKSAEAQSKLLLVMAYIKIYAALNGCVGMSVNYLVKKLGYKPDQHKGRINDRVIEALKWLELNNYICIYAKLHTSTEVVLEKIKATDCFIVQINFDNDIFNVKDKYVILKEKEYEVIVGSEVTKCDKQDLLNVFLNIKKYMNFDSVSANLCYPSHATLCKECKITSTGAMNNIIKELLAMGILYTYNSGQYSDGNGNIKYANSFYAVDEKELDPGSCDRIIKNYYSSQGISVEKFIN